MFRSGLWAVLVTVAVGAPAAWAIQAGVTFDVHQDITEPGLWPNDFHVEGYICSNGGNWPMIIDHLDDLFAPNFTYTVMPLQDCWYWFEATWWRPQGQYIPYCSVLHLGLLLDVEAANVIIDLIGWWTRDGVPVGHLFGGLMNRGYVPLMGFNVADTGTPQIVTLANGQQPILPPLPPPPINPPPWPPEPFPLTLTQVDVVPFPPGPPPSFQELSQFGQQQSWPWVPVTHANGIPINPGQPLPMAPDSFFDIFLESAPPPGGLGVQQPFAIPAGGFLVARQRVLFLNNSGLPEERWFWEIHGAQPGEACCFGDGHCEELAPFACASQGGLAMGPGTSCASTTCALTGACCLYGDVQIWCVETEPAACEQFMGTFKGSGTTCEDLNGNTVADLCEDGAWGACCYEAGPAIQCTITDALTCETQYPQGHWMGVFTTCADLSGNGVADLCEVSPPVCVGDVNCDGQVDFADINPFVAYLANVANWQSQFPGCDPRNGDINGDGLFPSFGDINPFVNLLSSHPLPIPCPD